MNDNKKVIKAVDTITNTMLALSAAMALVSVAIKAFNGIKA